MRSLPVIVALIIWSAAGMAQGAPTADQTSGSKRPNIVLFLADDWSRTASCYADPAWPSICDVVKTPNIDRVAREGVRLNNAFYACPQCTPSRAAIVSGCYFWRCGSDAVLKGGDWKGQSNPFDALPRFPHLLSENGYYTARQWKTLDFRPTQGGARDVKGLRYGLHVSAGKTPDERDGRKAEIVAETRSAIGKLLADCPSQRPFFFVYGPTNTHRPYVPGSGRQLWGIDPDALQGKLPAYLPDVPEIREDIADALGEVQATDLMIGVFLDELAKSGRLDDTLLILTGDNGLPGVPHGKTQLYDLGSAAPLLVRWKRQVPPGRTIDDFVNLMDLAPTFLEAAGIVPPEAMDGRSLLPQLCSTNSGTIDPSRDHVVVGRERHVTEARAGNLPYPSRAIRTEDFLYIRNFQPDRWPFGDPTGLTNAATPDLHALRTATYTTFSDMDASGTKAWLVANRNDPEVKPFYELAFARRPAEELYDLRSDPHQTRNVAAEPSYAGTKQDLNGRLMDVLSSTQDPRLTGAFDHLPYVEQEAAASPRKRGARKGKAGAAERDSE